MSLTETPTARRRRIPAVEVLEPRAFDSWTHTRNGDPRGYIDADRLKELASELAGDGIDLLFARVHQPVREMMRRSGVEESVGPDHIYPAIQDAVDEFLQQHPEDDATNGAET